jgi:3-oxoadipate enol-lactonase
MERFFSPKNRASAYAESIRRVLLGTDPQGYAACCVALRDVDFKGSLTRIKTPTLAIGSDADPSTPWDGNGELLARGISGARTALLHGAHLSNLEQPHEFTEALTDFLLQPV